MAIARRALRKEINFRRGSRSEFLSAVPDLEVALEVLRPGHFKTLDYMSGPEFLRIKTTLDTQAPGGVYFRPLEAGLRMVDLGVEKNPRMAAGPMLARSTSADEFETTLTARLISLVNAESEEGFSMGPELAAFILAAQDNRLVISGMDGLLFVHAQWPADRYDQAGRRHCVDLLAVDPDDSALVLIELKSNSGGFVSSPEGERLGYFRRYSSELHRYFEKLARVMGELYECPELAEIRLDPAKLRATCARPVNQSMGWVLEPA